MRANDPTLWSATEQAAAIRARRLGSEELLDLFLARIAHVGIEVNAVCTLDVDRARGRCRAADRAAAREEWWGPLHGLPITIKDAIETAGIRSTGGSVALQHHVPDIDAPAVASLLHAGAVVFGKTNLPEWSGEWQSFNDLFGTTNNPWALERTPGGSSGGAAAAVACGMTSFELGTDIGGSVRVPAAFCGVFGHKPSFGIIPTFGYLDEPAGGTTESDINTFGPIARDAGDLALLLDLLAAPSPDRAPAWRLELPRPSFGMLAGMRVGAWIDEPAMECDAAMVAVLHGAVDAIESAGAIVDRSARLAVDIDRAWRLGARMVGAAVSVSDGFDIGVTHRDWLFMNRRRAQLRDAWSELFTRVDVVVTPVTLVPAFEHQQAEKWDERTLSVNSRLRRHSELEGWPAIVGAAYLPATVVPVGRTQEGLPVGLQVVAPYLHDHSAIKFAALVADVTGGYEVPPILRR